MSRGRQKKYKAKKYETRNIPHADIMGIDWGRSDVGIALAETETGLASAYTTLHNDSKLLGALGKIIQEKGVKKVVMGIPSPLNRKAVFYDSEKLGELMEHNLGVVVVYQNEMFSTKIAQTYLMDKGIKKIERFDDQEAAKVILQDYLDRETLDK